MESRGEVLSANSEWQKGVSMYNSEKEDKHLQSRLKDGILNEWESESQGIYRNLDTDRKVRLY